MDDFLRSRLFIKPKIELDKTYKVLIIFANGNTVTHNGITEVSENEFSYVLQNSYESYIYRREIVIAIKMEEE